MMLFGLALASCKKYEDGPSLSFRSKESRLCKTWKMSKIIINGTETPDTYNSRWEFDKSGDFSRIYTDQYTGQDNHVDGSWVWDNDKENIIVTVTIESLGITQTENYSILGLKDKELHITCTSGGNLCDYLLVK